MPRSHSTTSWLPPASRYSAASSHSFTVADGPRFSSTGLRIVASWRSSAKFCMLRAPTCSMSAYSQISSTSSVLITSVTIGQAGFLAGLAQDLERLHAQSLEVVRRGPRLVGSAAQQAGARPSSPRARSTASARAIPPSTGPAITTTSSPPMERRPRSPPCAAASPAGSPA